VKNARISSLAGSQREGGAMMHRATRLGHRLLSSEGVDGVSGTELPPNCWSITWYREASGWFTHTARPAEWIPLNG
jgi:hypothetical protein